MTLLDLGSLTVDGNEVTPTGQFISLMLLNAASLAKAGAILQVELKQNKCLIALITESWFTDKHNESYLSISNFQLFRRDRGRRGDSVWASVSKDLLYLINSMVRNGTCWEQRPQIPV